VLLHNPTGLACFISAWILFGVRYAASAAGLMPYPHFDTAIKSILMLSFGVFFLLPIVERACRSVGGCIGLALVLLLVLYFGNR
jgi:hypothetical protein